jgi:hypothetical protein
MMGGQGLKEATEVAILNANYVAKRLAPFSRFSTPETPAWSPTNASSTSARSPRERHHRGGRGQAPDGLWFPRAHHELAGRRHPDDRTHRVRIQGRARPLLRCDDFHPRRDHGRHPRRTRRHRQPAQERPAPGGGRLCQRVAARLHPRAGRLPPALSPPAQVLAVRRPASTTCTATATSSAPATAWKPTLPPSKFQISDPISPG